MKANYKTAVLAMALGIGLNVGLNVGMASSASAADLAKVNGKSITDQDLKSALSGLTEGQRSNVLKDVNTRRQILDSLIEQELLTQQGEKEKIDQDEQYKQALAAFRKQYISNKLLEKNLGTKVTDAAVKKYYSANKGKYSTEQVHAMHILVDDEAKAKDLKKQAQAKGADFQALAEKHSKDPSAKNNRGDLGFFTRDRMVEEFTSAAFDADKDEIVGPVKTTYGYHVIKVIDKKAGKPMDFGDVEMRVRNDLRQTVIKDYLDKLEKQAKIEVDQKALEKI